VKLGLGRGDVVTLFSPNCPQFTIATIAIGAAGAILSPVNPAYTTGMPPNILTEVWWLICRFDALCLKGRGFESRSSHHVETLGKSFTRNCL